MRETLPHVLLSYEDTLPEALVQPFIDIITQSPGLDFEAEPRPPMGPQAGIHWLMPTAAVLYITKSYFDGYLKEAGKEHYHVLKKALGSLWASFFGENRAVRVTLIATPGKLPADHDKYSVTISVMADADAGLRFKLLFEDETTAEEFNRATAKFLDFLKNYYAGHLDQATQMRLASTRVLGKTILAAYDKTTGEFIFLDPIRPKQNAGN